MAAGGGGGVGRGQAAMTGPPVFLGNRLQESCPQPEPRRQPLRATTISQVVIVAMIGKGSQSHVSDKCNVAG